jgi:hypothetical protein
VLLDDGSSSGCLWAQNISPILLSPWPRRGTPCSCSAFWRLCALPSTSALAPAQAHSRWCVSPLARSTSTRENAELTLLPSSPHRAALCELGGQAAPQRGPGPARNRLRRVWLRRPLCDVPARCVLNLSQSRSPPPPNRSSSFGDACARDEAAVLRPRAPDPCSRRYLSPRCALTFLPRSSLCPSNAAASGVQCIIPWRGDDMEWRHLKVAGDLGVVAPVPFNPRDDDSIHRALEGSDIVINLIGKVRKRVPDSVLPPSHPPHTTTSRLPPQPPPSSSSPSRTTRRSTTSRT